MKAVILTVVLLALIIGVILLRRRGVIGPPAPTMKRPQAPSKNQLQSLEDVISKKTGVPLSQIGHAAESAETKLWNSGTGGKIGAVALAPFAAPTAVVQSAIDHPEATAKAAAHALQTGAAAVTHVVLGAPPAVARAVVAAPRAVAKTVANGVTTGAKAVGGAAKSVGKKILSIF